MTEYTPNNLLKRNKIIKSHKLFGKCLHSYIINKLIHIFDEKHNYYSPHKIIELIQNERKIQGLYDSNIKIRSELYGDNKSKSTLFIKILKDNLEFIHLSIHLCVDQLDAHKTGIIHFSKIFIQN